MTDTTRPSRVRVIADPTPGVRRTDSDEIFWWAGCQRQGVERSRLPAEALPVIAASGTGWSRRAQFDAALRGGRPMMHGRPH
jgi:hypothetical protein